MKTWGCDPELMLKKGTKYISAIDIVPASPEHRLEINGHAFYYDNVLAEFAMNPANNREKALENIKECLELYNEIVNPCKLVVQAYQEYPKDIWNKVSEASGKPIAAVAGCAIDSCGYLVKRMKAPKEIIENTTERSGGGHIHLGDNRLIRDYGLWIAPSVVLMDLLIGIPLMFLDRDSTGPTRRKIYGQAGRYRICSYGLEYRTPSNFWLSSPKLTGLVYDLCEFVCEIVTGDKLLEHCKVDEDKYVSRKPAQAYEYLTFDAKKLRSVINTSNKNKKGREFYDLSLSLMPKGLAKDVDNLIKVNSYDFYKEWDL